MKTKRLKLTSNQYFNHFFSAGVLFLVPILLTEKLTEQYGGLTIEVIQISALFVLPSLYRFLVQFNKLKFRHIRVNVNKEELTEAVNRAATRLSWVVKERSSHSIRAYRKSTRTDSLSEMITIEVAPDGLLFNSIVSPDEKSFSLSAGRWNNINKQVFIECLSDEKMQIPKENDVCVEEKEISPRRNLFRVFMYPFCILLIIAGLFLLSTGVPNGITGGLFIIIVPSVWMYADMRIVQKNIQAGQDND